MIIISRTGIRNLATNDIIYAKGLQYYKENRIVSATYANANKQYRLVVKGNYNYSVIVREQEDGSFDYSCNCPSQLKDQGACKHVVAALLFILKYQERTLLSESKSPEEKTALHILDYFITQEDTGLAGETFQLEVFITIPFILKQRGQRAMVSLCGGGSRKYKIQTVKKFLSNLYHRESFSLGKEFKFVQGVSTFDSESMEILDYLLELYEMDEIMDSSHYSKIFSKSEMILTTNMLLKLLKTINNQSFTLQLYGKTYENVHFLRQNPRVSYRLSLDEESITVDYQEKETVLPITETGELLYFDGIIYMPDKNFIRYFKPFYNSLGHGKCPLVFQGKNKIRFLEHVLPKISETMDLDVPEELKSRYITCDMEANIYFDKYKQGVKAELKYKYGDYEFNSFGSPCAGSNIIVRQKEKEDAITTELFKYGFLPYTNFYLLKDENKIYDFLSGKIMELESKASLFYSEDFRKLGIHPPGSFKAGVRMNSKMNMLELDLSMDDIPKDELMNLFSSFQVKKKFYRLKSGSFISLDDHTICEAAHILDLLNVEKTNIQDNNTILLEKQHALYLEKAFSSEKFEFHMDYDVKMLTERILNPASSDYPRPSMIMADLRQYQVTGYQWLRTLASNGLGGILADDMGLGKTLQSIVYISSYVEENGEKKNPDNHFLIVCPTSLIYNWLDEIENFAPSLKAVVVCGMPVERQETIEKYEQYDILITSYPLIRRDISFYEKIQFHTVFIDEAQFIKNDSSMNAKSVKQLKAKNRFALTGTPIENSLSELWSIFDFIMPGYLQTHSRFVEIYEKPIMKEDLKTLHDLHQHIAPFILRRMKKDVLEELPDKYETKMLTDLSEDQKKVYLSYLEHIRGELNSNASGSNTEHSRIKILAALTRLRQICCHPSTFIDNYQGGSGKLDLLMEIISEGIANDHRILVFSQFTSMLKIIEDSLKDLELSYFYLEGNTPTATRNDYVKRFNSGEGKVFLISLKAGGTGLNLTGADTVIHYDPWWNPAVEDQATDRAYRIGQKNKVHVMKLITKGTIEEKIYKLQKKKRKLSDSIMNSKEVFINTLTREELMELFTPME
jgi:SNF2 family DNA or RNA helicase